MLACMLVPINQEALSPCLALILWLYACGRVRRDARTNQRHDPAPLVMRH